MGQHKKQHYVQQSYLRRFSPNGKQIYVYDKVIGKEFLRGIEIAFPLSSIRILTIADRAFYGHYENFSDGKSRNLDAENVKYYNSLQILDSERQVYCEKPDFGLVKDMIEKNPALGKIKSDRVEIEIK